MILTLVHEDEQVLFKSASALSEKAGGHGGDAMPWPQQDPGARPAPSSWACWSVMLQCMCFLVYTWRDAAWGQDCHMRSFRFAFLLKAWPRVRELDRNAQPPASPRLAESECSLTRPPQGFRCTFQLEKHYLKTQEGVLSPAHKGQCMGCSWNTSQIKPTDIH